MDNYWASRLQTLEDRAYNSYKSRLEACKRLEGRGRALGGLVIALSLSSLIAAGGMLRKPDLYGPNGDVLWLSISIVTFAGSLASSAMGYAARSRNMFQNYRKLQRLSVKAEVAKGDPKRCNEAVFGELNDEYNDLLDESENHTTVDYLRAGRQLDPPPRLKLTQRFRLLGSWALTNFPWVAVALPALLLVPAFKEFAP